MSRRRRRRRRRRQARLARGNVFVLHRKRLEGAGGEALYCSARTEAGSVLLVEVQVLAAPALVPPAPARIPLARPAFRRQPHSACAARIPPAPACVRSLVTYGGARVPCSRRLTAVFTATDRLRAARRGAARQVLSQSARCAVRSESAALSQLVPPALQAVLAAE
jgi:hypothetical protein